MEYSVQMLHAGQQDQLEEVPSRFIGIAISTILALPLPRVLVGVKCLQLAVIKVAYCIAAITVGVISVLLIPAMNH